MLGNFYSKKSKSGRPYPLIYIAYGSIISGFLTFVYAITNDIPYWTDTFSNYPVQDIPLWYAEHLSITFIGYAIDILFILSGYLLLRLRKIAYTTEMITTICISILLAYSLNFVVSNPNAQDIEAYKNILPNYFISIFTQIIILFYIRSLLKQKILT